MNITLLTYGSRGDVQPFLALAVGLQRAGHRVTLAAPQRFAAFIESYGITCAPLAGDPDELSRLFNDAGTSFVRQVRAMQTHVMGIAPQVIRGVRAALQGADLLVHSFAFTTGGHSLGRELSIPDVSLQLFPMFAPTAAFPAIGLPDTGVGWLNRWSHRVSAQVFWHGGNLSYLQLRRRAAADFPARLYWAFAGRDGWPVSPLIFAISPQALPRPADWNQPHIHLPGYLFLKSPDYQPPDALANFMEAGPPPVCITFGSMVNRAAERTGRAVLAALQATGDRAVILTGWGGWRPEQPPQNTLFLEGAPHDWLFPRCRAVVHHGGAGTTAAGLHAGVPSILVPHIADQPFWGRQVASIGAGPQPIPVRRLTAETLAQALRETEADILRRRAAELGALVQAEDGVGKIVKIIEEHAGQFSHTKKA